MTIFPSGNIRFCDFSGGCYGDIINPTICGLSHYISYTYHKDYIGIRYIHTYPNGQKKVKKEMTTNEDKKYKGWTNYETWLVNLWLSNDQYDELMIDMAKHSKGVYSLMEKIKDLIEELNPLKDNADVFSDLLNDAISECNFYEIAEHYYNDNFYEIAEHYNEIEDSLCNFIEVN